ncbi:MAG: FeoB-associated Cys-rich membrane protein [Muribaculaceae bacterium]|jgi:hypothetical protein
MSTTTNLIIQYIFVGLVIIGAFIWIIWKLIKLNKKGGGCCGCDLADACNKKNLKMKPPKDCCG